MRATRRALAALPIVLLARRALAKIWPAERGLASWYGPGFHGRPMANGRRFDQWGRSAAHKTLPFGTVCEIFAVATGRTALVIIEDRGPFIPGRFLDVSRGTAQRLGVEALGVFRCEMVPLGAWDLERRGIVTGRPIS